jgi:Tetratricopeptide repeat/Dolichyl-phosphate-mannose-protein mannosyltransferase
VATPSVCQPGNGRLAAILSMTIVSMFRVRAAVCSPDRVSRQTGNPFESRPWHAPALIFALAAALRLGHTLASRNSLYFDHPVIDAQTYHETALAIAFGSGHPNLVFWQPPGYAYFLAFLYLLGGPSLLLPRLVQSLFGAFSAVLTYALGMRFFGARVGMAAGFGFAVYGPLIYFDGELLTPSLAILLQLLTVFVGIRAADRGQPTLCLGAGLLGGAATLVNAPAIVTVPVIAALARRRAALVVIGALIAISPAAIRNFVRGGELVLVSSNAGVNFFIGNNPRYDDMVAIRPGAEWNRLVDEPARAGIRGRNSQSGYFFRRVFAFVQEDPVGFVLLQGKKLRLLVSGHEIPRNREIYASRPDSPVLRWLLWKTRFLAFPFGLLAPLGFVGLAVSARRAPPLAAVLLVLSGAVLAFFVTARYRAPLVPFLLVFAAEGVRWFLTKASRDARVVALIAAAVLYVAANLGQGPMPTKMNADAEHAVAIQLVEEGRYKEALALLQSALRERPDSADAWVSYGILLRRLGRHDEAVAATQAALRLDPGHPFARHNLAVLERGDDVR